MQGFSAKNCTRLHAMACSFVSTGQQGSETVGQHSKLHHTFITKVAPGQNQRITQS